MFLPIFTDLAEKEDIKMVAVNIDENKDEAIEAGVQGIPTVIIFKDGKEAFKNVGFMTPEQLTEFVNQAK
jgi:thioredoxin 1